MKTKTDAIKRSRLMYIIEAAVEFLISILVGGSFFATITTYLEISDSLTGILSSFVSLGCLFQMLSMFFRPKNTKRFVIILSIANQLLFTLFYVIPIFDFDKTFKTIVFVIFILIAYLIYNIAHPKKIDWFMSHVDEKSRGSFTANKEIISLLSGMAFTFIMGMVIDHFKSMNDLRMGFVFSAITMLVLTALHTVTMFFTAEKANIPTQKEKNRFKGAISVCTNKKVLKIMLVFVLWNAAHHASVPFYSTYLIKDLGFSLTVTSIISLVSNGARILVSKFWGAYADRNSFAKMIRWCFLIAAFAFLVASFAAPGPTRWIYLAYSILHAIGLGGINSALINLCYDYVPYESRPDALALSQAAYGLSGFISTLIMSPLITVVQQNGNTLFGLPIYAQQVASIIAFLITLLVALYVSIVVIPIKRERGVVSK